MEIKSNYPLKLHNTFNIDVKAKYYVEVDNVNDIYKLLESEIYQSNKYYVIGGGSNILFTKDYNGLIINVMIKGIHIIESNDEYLILDVGAGEDWTKFVETCVKSNYYGIENLAMIPGKVGSAPVQNIGAYGVEQKDAFVSLNGIDLQTRELKKLSYSECEFSYRSSIFKNLLKDSFIITSVQYKLSRNAKFNLNYQELEKEIKKFQVITIDLRYIFDTICRLRSNKLPNPKELGSGGSFFKNPVVDANDYILLKDKYGNIPGYLLSDGKYKLSAGWLIDQLGWKGKRIGDAGVYEKHALVLVNYGNARGEDIKAIADEIIISVRDKFGITLSPEVIIL